MAYCFALLKFSPEHGSCQVASKTFTFPVFPIIGVNNGEITQKKVSFFIIDARDRRRIDLQKEDLPTIKVNINAVM